jgi:hypothetical protein
MSRKHHVRFGGGPTEKYRPNNRQLAGGLPYQAAVAALIRAGVSPPGVSQQWSHAFVQARFAGDLVTRRKQYPTSLRDALSRLAAVREVADYEPSPVSRTQASRARASAREFLAAVGRGGERR